MREIKPYPIVDKLINVFDSWLKHRQEIREMREFDIGIEKQNVVAFSLSCSEIAADRGHSAANNAHPQPIAEAQDNFASTIRRVGVSY